MGQSEVEIRGYTSFNRQAPFALRFFSIVIDLFSTTALYAIASNFLKITPIPGIANAIIFLIIFSIYWIPQRIFLGPTFGERIWRLAPKKNDQYRLLEPLYCQDYVTLVSILISSFFTTLLLVTSLVIFQSEILSHPIWLKNKNWKLQPFIPSTDQWLVTPFFYVIGGWPKTFEGKPIFYTLIYEKGPPSRFIGHIVAHWEDPDIKLVFEGPKTPELRATPGEIRDCLLVQNSYRCLLLKDSTLNRHIYEMRSLSPQSWKVQWFSVDDPNIPLEDQTQGIYLSASSDNLIQDRFVLINPNGKQQAIILNRPKTPHGDTAFEMIQKSIGSIRSFPELDSGRAWINRTLGDVRLKDLQSLSNSNQITTSLAEIQTMLISRISVDPGSFDSYFHLAGTSLMLAKSTANDRNFRNLIAQKNLESAYRFATDIAPQDSRTVQIQNLWLETNKF